MRRIPDMITHADTDSLLLIFAVAFMGCVLATPVVTRIAVWAGAIDRPDNFRRVHKGATPRMGGLGIAFDLLQQHIEIGLPSLALTLVWFLGCMNIWNLIDGMDGLATGVGLLVSGTLMLIAIYQDNLGAAMMAAGLAGSLAGFLLYNW